MAQEPSGGVYARLRNVRAMFEVSDVPTSPLSAAIEGILNALIDEFGQRAVRDVSPVEVSADKSLLGRQFSEMITDHAYRGSGTGPCRVMSVDHGAGRFQCEQSMADHLMREPLVLCSAALNIAGEHFGCDMQLGLDGTHRGWAHANKRAEAIWDGPS